MKSQLLISVIVILTITACKEQPRTEGRPGDSTAKPTRGNGDTIGAPATVKGVLPTGRFQLYTRHTPAPDLWITLPEGYTIKDKSRLPNDEFLIFRKDDPNMKDATKPIGCVMRVYVGVMPQSAYDKSSQLRQRGELIAGRPMTWKIWQTMVADKPYYNQELTSSDFFAGVSPELARAPLHLHVYIGGSDPGLVQGMAGSAKSLGFKP